MAARDGRKAGGQPTGPTGRGGRGPRQSDPTTRRRTSRLEPESTGTSATPRGSAHVTSRALILLLVVAVLGVSYASSIRAWLNQRNEAASLSAQIANERAQIAQLRQQKLRWNDPAYIEAQARLRFGWVMPGERSYRVIGKDGKVVTAGHSELSTPSTPAGAAAPPWWTGVVGSLTEAGSPPTPKKQTVPVHHPATLIGPRGPSGR